MNNLTTRNYYKAELWNEHLQRWVVCMSWDGCGYYDIESDTIDELFEKLEHDLGSKEYLMDAIYYGRLRISKVRKIVDYSEEEVKFPLTT